MGKTREELDGLMGRAPAADPVAGRELLGSFVGQGAMMRDLVLLAVVWALCGVVLVAAVATAEDGDYPAAPVEARR